MLKVTLAVLAASVFVPASHAAETENPFAQSAAILNLDGVDLATPEGQRKLSIRMDQTARKVCGERLYSIHLALEAESRQCRAEVSAELRSRVAQRSADAGSSSPIG